MPVPADIRPLIVEDAAACDAVVASLPYHFGNEDGRRLCAEAVRSQDGLVAVERDPAAGEGDVVGFLTFERHFEASAEITWMAVRADRRHGGVGTALLDEVCARLEAEGRTLLLAFTVSPSEPDDEVDGYDATRAFYRSRGFETAREVPELWPDDPAILLVRVLGGA
ncbi:MAG: GNAT family N-acetyltransferase [Actinomycetota bacterium]